MSTSTQAPALNYVSLRWRGLKLAFILKSICATLKMIHENFYDRFQWVKKIKEVAVLTFQAYFNFNMSQICRHQF